LPENVEAALLIKILGIMTSKIRIFPLTTTIIKNFNTYFGKS